VESGAGGGERERGGGRGIGGGGWCRAAGMVRCRVWEGQIGGGGRTKFRVCGGVDWLIKSGGGGGAVVGGGGRRGNEEWEVGSVGHEVI